MSFHRVLMTSCRELLTRRPGTVYAGSGNKTFRSGRKLLRTGAGAALLTLALWTVWTLTTTGILWKMYDLSVYHQAARSMDAQGQSVLYTDLFGIWDLPFIYPPFPALIFTGLLPLGFAGLKWFMTISSILALAAVAWASFGMLGYRRSLGRLGASLAAFAVVFWLEPVSWTLIWGQVNLILLAVVLLDLAQPDTRRGKGIGIGLAAGFKLTPAIFIVYLLITRRFRAAGTALGAFAATAVLGWLVLPDASRTYWTHLGEISGRVDGELSVGTLNNQSVKGLLTRAVDNESLASVLWLLVCAVVAILAMLAAAKLSRVGQELAAVVVVGGLSLVVSPISWSHHWVWVVPAFILLAHTAYVRRRRAWWWATGGFFVLFASWPLSLDPLGRWNGDVPLQPFGLIWFAPRDHNRESAWNTWQFFVGNGYLLAGLAMLLTVSWLALKDTRTTPAAPAPTATLPAGRTAGATEPVGR